MADECEVCGTTTCCSSVSDTRPELASPDSDDPDDLFATLVDVMADAVVRDRWSDEALARERTQQDVPDEVWRMAREGDRASVSDEMADAIHELVKPEHRPALLAFLAHCDAEDADA